VKDYHTKEPVMTRSLSLVSIFLFSLTGCVTVNELPETSDKEISQPVEVEPSSVVAFEKQSQPADSATQEPVANETAPANKSLTKDQIQVIQDLLKSSGFDPGAIDGILGPKTRTALHQYQAGCAMLTNLLGTSDREILQQTPESQPITAMTEPNRNPSKDQIRLVQERLKASGYDPGPIDGVMGAKTKSALQQYQASHGLSNSGILGH